MHEKGNLSMFQSLHCFISSVVSVPGARLVSIVRGTRLLLVMLALLAALVFNGTSLPAQSANQVTQEVDPSQVQILPQHVPAWANKTNNAGSMPASLPMGQMTMVLARSQAQEAAFDKFLADQQNPASPDFHHWLTPEQIGERFGLSQQDVDSVTGWLQSQGLHVNWVAPSRIFIGFGGTVENTGRAFHTELHYYHVNGEERFSVASDPMIPKALVPVIKAIRGLYTVNEKPLSHSVPVYKSAPEFTLSQGVNVVVPEDFATIYDLPGNLTGAGETIGIVGESRTDFTDFKYFRNMTGSTFSNPTEVVPTAFGGVDPGPAYTSPPAQSVSTGAQGEAELDVTRSGSVAPGAKLLLVVATGASGGIGDDAQYLVQTSPVPVQIMTISFGGCESEAGASGVNFWDPIFKQAAGEGISVFVASGDAGASGCDAYNAAPPASPKPNSPNYICSSSYATCLGGTEFNDTANPAQYWGTNDSNLGSALSYIPEGGWNEPLNSNSDFQAASSGGGVSLFVAIPSWQKGTGVPSAKAGRYTPDIAFTAANHDGYFGCFAALSGADCIPDSSGNYGFIVSSGTSAASPDMAGVTALLDQQMAGAQGSFNPQLYQLAASTPAAFHDATVSTSGVSGCSVKTPSICNNSIPTPTALTGGQAGFLLQDGYDEVTGLGSLDVSAFITAYAALTSTLTTPTVKVTPSLSSITTTQALTVTAAVSGPTGSPTPTGSVILTSGSYSSAAATLSSGSATISVPAGSLAAGTDTLTVNYTPDSASSATYNSATGSSSVTVTAVAPGSYALTNTAATVTSPGSSGTSTITVTPSNGFTGIVVFTCALATSPSDFDPNYAPGCLFSPPSVSITGASAQTSTMTISTFAPTTGKNEMKNLFWPSAGGATLALLLFFGLPRRRRNWLAMLGLLAVFAAFAGLGCGGGSGSGGGGGGGTPGTTTGTYTFTVTGASGALTENTTVTVTVN
jgi:subtilase family serine protease